MVTFRGSGIFFPPKNKKLARQINISSPMAFKKSIFLLKKGGVTRQEKSALVLARTRAQAQLSRKNLSSKERREFGVIARMSLPKITKR